MKRLLIAMGLVATVAGFSSCKKTEVTQIIDNTQAIVFTINPADWKATDNTNKEYVVSINTPEIDQDMFQNGSVLVYISMDQQSQTFDALPSTIGNYVLTTYHTVGGVYIDLTFFDGQAHAAPNAGVPCKIMLVRAGSVSN
ncbi:hypothetical protein [Chitinophaga parva]|nr:hypothetical protein [Chitinophaga parva]